MFKQHRFTLIEIIVVAGILGIVALMIAGGAGVASGDSKVSWGVNGMTEVRCIDGYKFVVGEQGNARQVMDDSGRGVRCGNPDPGKMGSFGSK